MITIIEKSDVYEVRFPYDATVVSLIKNVPGKWYVAEHKYWTIPRNRLGFLLAQFKNTPYESQVRIVSSEHINENQSLDVTGKIPDVDISNVPIYVAEGCKPFKHQLDFMKFAIYRQKQGSRSGFILADQPGAGKTMEVLNLAMYNRYNRGTKHCLIICCVNSAKYNWYEDIQKHTNGKEVPYILGSRLKRDKVSIRYNTGSKEKLKDLITGHMYGDEKYPPLPYFLVVNIEAFRYREKKHYIFTKEIISWIKSGLIDMIAIDEIHKNVSMSSKQGQQLLEIKRQTNSLVEWIPMTGTPITKRPTDVFLPLRLVDGHFSSNYYMWCQEYCIYGGFGDHEIIGYKNIDRLKRMLQPNMLRRLKKDILDLPPKLRKIEYVENTSYQNKLYENMLEQIEREKDQLFKTLNPLSAFLKLRQVNGSPELVDNELVVDDKYLSKNAKLSRLLEIIEECVQNEEKVIVFSNWVEPLRTLYKFISKRYKTCCYTGTMKPDVREQHKQVFIHNPEYTVMLGTIGALGTSHTLTVARNIIFYDEPWSISDREQCEDRCHRPGTTQSLNIVTLLSKDTIDDTVHNILLTGEGVSNYIVDNKLDLINHPELVNLLLGHSTNL